MGQYYKFIILAQDRKSILLVIYPHDYKNGLKLMEQSYINKYSNNEMMNMIEVLLSPHYENFHKGHIVWAGDYAEEEEGRSENLYHISENYSKFRGVCEKNNLRYIVNHTKKLYIDKTKFTDFHPLPLLTSEGNGTGGGDYYGSNKHLCGTWARDSISVEYDMPENYDEFISEFNEY